MVPSAGMYAGGLHSQCCNRDLPGANDSSYGHWEQDAAMFVAWKINYLKSDPCGVHAKGDAIGRFNQRCKQHSFLGFGLSCSDDL